MNIYKISRKDFANYYQWAGAVVVANSADEARFIHPDGNPNPGWWNLRGPRLRGWVHPKDVLVELIGTTPPVTNNLPYVVLGSYRG